MTMLLNCPYCKSLIDVRFTSAKGSVVEVILPDYCTCCSKDFNDADKNNLETELLAQVERDKQIHEQDKRN